MEKKLHPEALHDLMVVCPCRCLCLPSGMLVWPGARTPARF